MMFYSVAPVSCTVELILYFLLFSSEVSLHLAKLSCMLGTFAPAVRAVKQRFMTRRGHVLLYQMAASDHTLVVGCHVQLQETSTIAFWQTGGREAGNALCFACHCDALYECCTVTPSCHCCRLLLCFCRIHLAAGTTLHHQELLWILFHCLCIFYQKKLI